MNSGIFWLFLGYFGFSDFFSGRGVVFGQDDGGSVSESLQCNYCVHSRKNKDVSEGVKHEPDCMNHLKFLSRPDLRRTCTPTERYCVTTVTNLNGFFIEVERDCAESCEQGCEQHGYGLFHTECTRCCREPLCNEFDGRHFYEPLAARNGRSLWAIIGMIGAVWWAT